MRVSPKKETSKRRPVNLTIRSDLLNEAKTLKLNASKAAEAGISLAIKEARAKEWLRENKEALRTHNKRISKNGPLLTPGWTSE